MTPAATAVAASFWNDAILHKPCATLALAGRVLSVTCTNTDRVTLGRTIFWNRLLLNNDAKASLAGLLLGTALL